MGFWKVLGNLAETVPLEAPGIGVSYHMPESKILHQNVILFRINYRRPVLGGRLYLIQQLPMPT